MSVIQKYLTCPFCLDKCIHAKPGKNQCRVCGATFEIDDRAECIFGDTENLKLPVTGNICAFCGLIQAGKNPNCLYCGIKINTALH